MTGGTTPRDGVPKIPTEIRFTDDLALAQGCVQGQRACWQTLIERYQSTVRLAVLHTLRARSVPLREALLEDLTSDVMVELVRNDFRKLRSYSGRCRLGSWLKVVASHYTIDYLRRKKPSLSLNDDTPTSRALRESLVCPRPGPEHILDNARRREALRQLWERLCSEDRRFVELFYEQGLGFEDTARAMDTTVGAIYARKNRVRKKLLSMAQDLGWTQS